MASGSSTPNSRFTSQAQSGEEQLKTQTVGLVTLSDFRKRRAEALESGESGISRGSTPADGDEGVRFVKKKRKAPKKGGLSFGEDEDENTTNLAPSSTDISRARTPASRQASVPADEDEAQGAAPKRLTANGSVDFVARSQTKSALAREAQVKDRLRKEFLTKQELVKATDFLIPFVFFDGQNTPGSICRVKKGDQVWRFLDKARKVGAEQSAGKGMKRWARVSVDDLMLVKDDLIIPQHYEFYFFMLNKTQGFKGRLFPHSADPTGASPATLQTDESAAPSGLTVPGQKLNKDPAAAAPQVPDAELEGYHDDPGLTKVVDRRWYERQKHIWPMSVWQDFNAEKDYTSEIRKDAGGNVFFSSNG